MEKDDHWRALSEQVLMNMKEWRKAHPKATLRELEDGMENRMRQLEAQLIEDLAQESPSQQWAQMPNDQRPTCPVCHTSLHARGKRSRILQGKRGQHITLSREYGTCLTCGTGLFPAFMRNWDYSRDI